MKKKITQNQVKNLLAKAGLAKSHKKCNRCNHTKPLIEFKKYRQNKKLYVQNICLQCKYKCIPIEKILLKNAKYRAKKKKLEALEEYIAAYEYFQNYEVFDTEAEIERLDQEGKLEGLKDNAGNVLTKEQAKEEARKYLRAKLKIAPKSDDASLEARNNLETAYKKYL